MHTGVAAVVVSSATSTESEGQGLVPGMRQGLVPGMRQGLVPGIRNSRARAQSKSDLATQRPSGSALLLV